MPVYTTLNRIRSSLFGTDEWKKLLHSLDKTKPDDEPLPLVTILDSNGFDDAVWCLRSVEGLEKEIRLLAVACAREVQHLMTDPLSVEALDVAERYAHGKATKEELEKAYAAAYAASDTARAYDTAREAADAAAYAAADAARAAATQSYEQAHEAAREKQAEIFRRIFG
jgi:hypothetical protein